MKIHTDNERLENILYILNPLLIACISAIFLSYIAMSYRFQNPILAYLEENRRMVMRLISSSAGVSSLVTILPGDIASPVAQKFADLSGYFVIILGALFLEKYLFLVMGVLTFRFFVPVSCVLLAAHRWNGNRWLKSVALKMLTLSLALFLVVPTSVKISQLIRTESEQAAIDKTIADAEKISQQMEEATNQDGNIIEKAVGTFTDSAKFLAGELEERLGDFLDAAAVMLITTCVVPMIVLLIVFWLLKTILNIPLDLPIRPHAWKHNKGSDGAQLPE